MPVLNRVELIGHLGRDPGTRSHTDIVTRLRQMPGRQPGEQAIPAASEAEEAVPA